MTEDEDTMLICDSCAGSGEGMYDGSTCKTCRGSGEVMTLAARERAEEAIGERRIAAYERWLDDDR